MFTVEERFVVKRGLLNVVVGGVGRVITQGSWVPKGAELPELTSEELGLYGEYVLDAGPQDDDNTESSDN